MIKDSERCLECGANSYECVDCNPQKENFKVVYKVCKITKDIKGNDKVVSVVHWMMRLINNRYCLQYSIDKWVTPKDKNTRLFAFDSLLSAKKYYTTVGFPDNYRIFKAITPCISYPKNIKYIPQAHYYINKFWNDYLSQNINEEKADTIRHKYNYYTEIPDGTVFVHRLKLLDSIPVDMFNEKIPTGRDYSTDENRFDCVV